MTFSLDVDREGLYNLYKYHAVILSQLCCFDGILHKRWNEVLNLEQIRTNSPTYDLLSELTAFSEGRSFHAWRHLGSHPDVDENSTAGYRFRVWAPNVSKITIIGDFNGWHPDATPMELTQNGIWEAFVPGLQRYDTYQYAIHQSNGSYVGKADPFAFHAATRPDISSKIYDLKEYPWGDAAWLTARGQNPPVPRPMNIYECHLGSWRRNGEGKFLSYRETASYLVPYAKEMGFTHVEFLPLSEHPHDASWGYQCTGYFAATSRYGTPDDLKFLIDQLHQAGIGVIMDWVPSHFPRDGFGLYYFDGTPTYEYANPNKGEHPDRDAMMFDLGRSEVRSFLYSSAMFWLEEYHIDGLRLDDLSPMLYLDHGRREGTWEPNCYGGRENPEAFHFLQTLNAEILSSHPDVLMMAKETTNTPNITTPVSEGGLGFRFKWNTGWMDDVCHYIKTDPYFRQHHHRDITVSLLHAFSENYILPLSHDEMVHGKASFLGKMPGDDPIKFAGARAFYTYMMTHPGNKLTFMGTELGQWSEWRCEYSLDWHLLQYEVHRQAQHFFKSVNNFYLHHPALWEQDDSWQGFQWLCADDAQTNTLAFLRLEREGNPLLVVCNFSPIHRKDHRVGTPFGGSWAPLFNSDSAEFGGTGLGDSAPVKTEKIPCHEQAQSILIDLPPMSTVIYRCTRRNPVRKSRTKGTATDISPRIHSKAKGKSLSRPIRRICD